MHDDQPTAIDGKRPDANEDVEATIAEPRPHRGPTASEGSSAAVRLRKGGSISAPSLATPGSVSLGAPTIDVPKPETALWKSAFEQTKRTAIAGLVFSAIGLGAAPLVGGEPWALYLFMGSMACSFLNNGWLAFVCRDESAYRETFPIAYFSISPVINAGALLYLGTFGPVLAMFVLNVYTASIAYSGRVARIVLGGSLLPFVGLGVAIAAGAFDDPGMITLSSLVGRTGQAVVIAAFSLFLWMTYSQGRRSRDLVVASLVERDAAIRRASHREALFLEARQDLERALVAGGLGRFSDQLLGSYKLGSVLGRGGMGEVYDATHVESGEPAAVKMLLPEVMGRPEYVRRFLREVRIAASLDSPHVVRVLEVGDEAAPIPFLAMERLEGEDLAQVLRDKPRLAPDEVLRLVHQLADAIGAAQAAGIVHRDLKPQNVFLHRGKTWKVLDFGVSKLMSGGGTLTHAETVGTPRYMAPEQARGGAVDHRADLYAIGLIAYRALTGHPPFKGDDPRILVDVLERMPVRPTALASMPADVDRVIAIAIAKRPEDRFQTAGELADAFSQVLGSELSSGLDAELVARADALLAQRPWEDPNT